MSSEIATKYKRFTPEEDALIKELVEVKKIKPWSKVAEFIPGRTGSQCRDRYNAYLYEEASTSNWTPEEDKIIVAKYKEFGPRWVQISSFLPGRNGNSVKNRWNKALSKYHEIGYNLAKQVRRNKDLKYSKGKTESMNPEEVYSPVEVKKDIEEEKSIPNALIDAIMYKLEYEFHLLDYLDENSIDNAFIL